MKFDKIAKHKFKSVILEFFRLKIILNFVCFLKFDLYCDKDIYVKAAQSVLMAGILVGSVTSGQLADFFGRRIILHVSMVMIALCGTAMALSWNYYLIAFFWFLIGFFQQVGSDFFFFFLKNTFLNF